jgi:hypothetical protein
MRGAKLCISHNPAAADLKQAAVSKGGRNRRSASRAPQPSKAVAVATISDVQALLFRTLEELRNGVLDAELARAVGYVAGVASKVYEAVELEGRVARLEEGAVQYLGELEKHREP